MSNASNLAGFSTVITPPSDLNVGIITAVSANVTNLDVSAGVVTAATLSGTTVSATTVSAGGSVTGVDVYATTTTSNSLVVNGNNYPSNGSFSFRNLVMNGDMRICQVSEDYGISTTASGLWVDRFVDEFNGGAVTQSQQSLTAGSPYEEGHRNFLRLANTTAGSTVSTDYRSVKQTIEAQNVATSGWKYTDTSSYVTLSFWIRSSVAQEFYGYLKTNDGTESRYAFSTGSLSADTWTKVTKTIPGYSNLTFDNDVGGGLEINISAFWGTNYTDSGVTTDTWANYASGTRTPDFTSTWNTTSNATFDVTGIQLEVGDKVTPFERRPYSVELELCRRYFERIELISVGAQIVAISGYGGLNAPMPMLRITPKRIVPTASFGGQTGNIQFFHYTNSVWTATSVAAWFVTSNVAKEQFAAYYPVGSTSGLNYLIRTSVGYLFVYLSAEY